MATSKRIKGAGLKLIFSVTYLVASAMVASFVVLQELNAGQTSAVQSGNNLLQSSGSGLIYDNTWNYWKPGDCVKLTEHGQYQKIACPPVGPPKPPPTFEWSKIDAKTWALYANHKRVASIAITMPGPEFEVLVIDVAASTSWNKLDGNDGAKAEAQQVFLEKVWNR